MVLQKTVAVPIRKLKKRMAERKKFPRGWEMALLSESSLAEDWLSKEDEEAWKDL